MMLKVANGVSFILFYLSFDPAKCLSYAYSFSMMNLKLSKKIWSSMMNISLPKIIELHRVGMQQLLNELKVEKC